jgi:hypothetical protein
LRGHHRKILGVAYVLDATVDKNRTAKFRNGTKRRFLRNPIRCFDGQLGIGTAFRFFRLASQPTETLVPFNVTWSGYSAVQIVVAEASAYNNVSSGLRHKKPEWPAESPICLLFGGSV